MLSLCRVFMHVCLVYLSFLYVFLFSCVCMFLSCIASQPLIFPWYCTAFAPCMPICSCRDVNERADQSVARVQGKGGKGAHWCCLPLIICRFDRILFFFIVLIPFTAEMKRRAST